MSYYRSNRSYSNEDNEYESGAAGVSSSAGQSYDGYSPNAPGEFNLNSVQLPPPNSGCYQAPTIGRGTTRHVRHPEQTVQRNLEQNFNDTKQLVKENNVHHHHVKNVLINVNRNHNHNVKVVNKDNNYHHYLTNNIVRVSDTHHQRIENVKGDGKTFNDYKQTQRVENVGCRRGQDSGDANGAAYASSGAAAVSYDQSSATAVAADYSASTGGSASYGRRGSANYY